MGDFGWLLEGKGTAPEEPEVQISKLENKLK
jgi:hypothetical protein